jgi:hypothetical protein
VLALLTAAHAAQHASNTQGALLLYEQAAQAWQARCGQQGGSGQPEESGVYVCTHG